jgi:hypothetical protein
MSSKTLIYFGLAVGSAVGGWLPLLWGASFLSFSSVLLTAVGGLVGIYLGFKLTRMVE